MTVAVALSRSGACEVKGAMASGRRGASRVRNDAAGYLIFASYGAPPDLAGAYTYAPTLPAAIALAPPVSGTRTYYVVVVRQDQFGLRSPNQFAYTLTIDPTGAEVMAPVPAPVGVSARQAPGGQVSFRAQYPTWAKDDHKASSWRVWVGATPPDPSVDPYTGTASVNGPVMPPLSVGTFAPGTYHWALALRRAADSSLSPAATGTLTILAAPATPTPVA